MCARRVWRVGVSGAVSLVRPRTALVSRHMGVTVSVCEKARAGVTRGAAVGGYKKGPQMAGDTRGSDTDEYI